MTGPVDRRPRSGPGRPGPLRRGWSAIRELPLVLQVVLAVLALLSVAAPVLVAAALDAAPWSAGRSDGGVGPDRWTVVHVVDGDTLDVLATDGTRERVRVVGIDTPERGECGYEAASEALAELLLGEQVALVAGARDDRDRYDRLLRYVDIESQDGVGVHGTGGDDRIDAGLVLLERGLAIARYDSRDGFGAHPREGVYVAADAAASTVDCGP